MPLTEIKPSITPMLTVSTGIAAVDFYKKAFGATEIGRVEVNGRIIITEINCGAQDFTCLMSRLKRVT